jgi:hypothetical protein
MTREQIRTYKEDDYIMFCTILNTNKIKDINRWSKDIAPLHFPAGDSQANNVKPPARFRIYAGYIFSIDRNALRATIFDIKRFIPSRYQIA